MYTSKVKNCHGNYERQLEGTKDNAMLQFYHDCITYGVYNGNLYDENLTLIATYKPPEIEEPPLTSIRDVQHRVKKIKEMSSDPEAAYSAENHLYIDILTLIASAHPQAAELAKAALESQKLDFPRFTA